ncbi:hypothetical protein SAMN02910265_01037 [Ruminococcus flavefaciens]|uniref:Uncharacterized protein n=1 Tax=Ruminococcus flavefaciens TaxID=1265 RepID=A0A1H6IMV8_RUMFL|nr:hypothetical protein [Ruminococcus flavefaciens]SEH50399.1 hypothetical protein SAMN02910265_01037 [Ruminococcus flavefaciens]
MKNTMKKTSKVHLVSLIGTIISFLILVISLVTQSFLMAQIVLGVVCVFCVATFLTAKQK